MSGIVTQLRDARVHDRVRQWVGDRAIIRVQRLIGPLVRRRLVVLAHVYWSDKAGHGYTQLYEQHLRHFRRMPIKLLEIGIGGYDSPTWGGSSLRTWRDYFFRGEIHGLDIYEKRIAEPRIYVHRGDQSDETFMRDLAGKHGPFDVIVDDGSHVNAHIRASFQALFEDYLNPGGVYVIEDMATAYDPDYGGGPPSHPGTSVELVKALVDDVNLAPHRVAALHVYEQIAFIQKAV